MRGRAAEIEGGRGEGRKEATMKGLVLDRRVSLNQLLFPSNEGTTFKICFLKDFNNLYLQAKARFWP